MTLKMNLQNLTPRMTLEAAQREVQAKQAAQKDALTNFETMDERVRALLQNADEEAKRIVREAEAEARRLREDAKQRIYDARAGDEVDEFTKAQWAGRVPQSPVEFVDWARSVPRLLFGAPVGAVERPLKKSVPKVEGVTIWAGTTGGDRWYYAWGFNGNLLGYLHITHDITGLVRPTDAVGQVGDDLISFTPEEVVTPEITAAAWARRVGVAAGVFAGQVPAKEEKAKRTRKPRAPSTPEQKGDEAPAAAQTAPPTTGEATTSAPAVPDDARPHHYDHDGSHDCVNGCGAYMLNSASGGPDGVDPFGDCPNWQDGFDRAPNYEYRRLPAGTRWKSSAYGKVPVVEGEKTAEPEQEDSAGGTTQVTL